MLNFRLPGKLATSVWSNCRLTVNDHVHRFCVPGKNTKNAGNKDFLFLLEPPLSTSQKYVLSYNNSQRGKARALFRRKLNYNRIGRIIVQQICFIQQLYKSVLCGLCLCVWLYLCHPRSLNRNLTIVIHEGCEQSLCSEKSACGQCIMAASIPSWAYQLQGGRSG